jgi:hypothetical protein
VKKSKPIVLIIKIIDVLMKIIIQEHVHLSQKKQMNKHKKKVSVEMEFVRKEKMNYYARHVFLIVEFVRMKKIVLSVTHISAINSRTI